MRTSPRALENRINSKSYSAHEHAYIIDICACVCGKMCVWPCGKQEEKEIERSREARFLDRKCTLFTVTSLEFSHSNGLSASPRSHGSHGASNGVSGSR